MGIPATRAQVEAAMGAAIKLIDQTYKYGSKNATNFVNLIGTLQPLIQGNYAADAAAAAQSMRVLLAGSVTRATAQNLLRPYLKMYCTDVIGRTTLSTDQEMLAEIYKYYNDNNLRVTGRNMTYGSPVLKAGSTGTVQLLRLTQDRFNFPIESGFLDAKRVRCLLDQNSGVPAGKESWLIEGQEPPPDDLIRSGSGLNGTLVGMTADDSVLDNADFRNFTATTLVANGLTTTPTAIQSWTSSTGVSSSVYNFDNAPTNIYRVSPSNTLANSYSLVFVASDLLSQALSVKGTKLNQDTPYIFGVIWNRVLGSASGTLQIGLGVTSNSVSVAAQTGWNISFTPPSRGWSNWYRNFAMAGVPLQAYINWTRTGGNLYVAEALLLQGVNFDGSWYWMVPSSSAIWIPPQLYDEFDFADLVSGTEGINQRTLAFAFGSYWPSSVGSSVTFADS